MKTLKGMLAFVVAVFLFGFLGAIYLVAVTLAGVLVSLRDKKELLP